jgi:hypothetical protein
MISPEISRRRFMRIAGLATAGAAFAACQKKEIPSLSASSTARAEYDEALCLRIRDQGNHGERFKRTARFVNQIPQSELFITTAKTATAFQALRGPSVVHPTQISFIPGEETGLAAYEPLQSGLYDPSPEASWQAEIAYCPKQKGAVFALNYSCLFVIACSADIERGMIEGEPVLGSGYAFNQGFINQAVRRNLGLAHTATRLITNPNLTYPQHIAILKESHLERIAPQAQEFRQLKRGLRGVDFLPFHLKTETDFFWQKR